jgi:hydroxyacylglutathione hydrolase
MSPTATKKKTKPAQVVEAYFAALTARDPDAMASFWAPDGLDRVHGQADLQGPDAVRDYFAGLFAAIPDIAFSVDSITAQEDRVAVKWSARGTFSGTAALNGIEPNGAPVALSGLDLLTVGDGLLVHNDAYPDNLAMVRSIGLLPPAGSKAEQGLNGAFNAKTRAARRLVPRRAPEEVADGVWRVQGFPARCNVYFVRETDGDGVVMFDAGARSMVKAIAAAGAALGGITRVVLGHGHTDHRGTAPALGAPVYCHPDEVLDAEGSGGFRYWGEGLPWLKPPTRQLHVFLHRRFWDGGPVQIAGTVEEGDDVAGFEVIHLPGHAPGLIALYRESDGVALTTDAFYSIDDLSRDSEPHMPIEGYSLDPEQAIASVRKLAAREPRVCLPGHGNAVTGDVRAQLERAADAG